MKCFQDKIAIVTGGASGIGRAFATLLCRYGAKVTIADINAALVEETAQKIGATAQVLDVTDAEAVAALVKGTADAHGHLDFMFNNAGIAVIGDALDMSLDDWNRLYDVNVRGVIHGVVAAYPIMAAQRSGHIVNTASVSGLIPAPGFAAYSGTKHAVVGMSVSLRAEAAYHGVRVSAVCPGFIDTPIKDNAKLLHIDREKIDAQPVPFYDVDACARDTMRGVAKNKQIIVVAQHAKAMSTMNRYFPRFMEWMAFRSHARNRQMKNSDG